jgi:hypothetical protein
VAVASLSLHYFPREQTCAAFARVRSTLRPGALFLFRVNASDDYAFGAGRGQEVEPGVYIVEIDGRQRLKRFFDEAGVRDALGGGFVIHELAHRATDRWGALKQTWQCLAEAA